MSIRLKLTLYWTAVLGAILLVAASAVFVLFERRQWGALDAALLEEADTSTAAMAQAGWPDAASILARLSRERDLGPSRRVRLLTAERVIADLGDRGADLPAVPTQLSTARVLDGRRRIFRYAVFPFVFAGGPARLEDGVDARAVRNSIARLRTTLLLVVPLVLALSAAGGYWLAARALRPVSSLTAALAAIQPRDLSRRLPPPAVADEIGQLTAVVNAMLDRIERASAAERRFASDAAHELRTPLSVLRTGLEVALSRERTPEQNRAALESALRDVIGLCAMAEDLLTLARLDGEISLERAPVNLRALLAEVAEVVAPVAQAKNLRLEISNDADAVVEGNSGHLKRLVLNLLDNALKFTPAEGAVELRLERDGGHARLCVADSGPGIPPSEIPHLFERFWRGSTSRGAGSGLGLSLCKEIARLHGGEISAANRPQGGSEFVVTLPLAGGAG